MIRRNRKRYICIQLNWECFWGTPTRIIGVKCPLLCLRLTNSSNILIPVCWSFTMSVHVSDRRTEDSYPELVVDNDYIVLVDDIHFLNSKIKYLIRESTNLSQYCAVTTRLLLVKDLDVPVSRLIYTPNSWDTSRTTDPPVHSGKKHKGLTLCSEKWLRD